MIRQLAILLAIASSTVAYISVVTGASGFVGRHVAYSLLRQHDLDDDDGDGRRREDDPSERTIVCLVRPDKVSHEQSYWNAQVTDIRQLSRDKVCVKVMPYDMLDGGLTLNDALEASIEGNDGSSPSSSRPICVYHVASVFGPTPDPIRTAKDNVRSAEDVVRTIDEFRRRHPRSAPPRLVLTSSMAAVRATDQTPLNGKYYTHRDWNALSELSESNWGSCYQWSKAESERRSRELVKECNERHAKEGGGSDDGGRIEMIALCPSFVFGPPPPMPSELNDDAKRIVDAGSSSYSLTLLDQWLRGKSPVQSRLCGDVRDVAEAHVAAGRMRLPEDDVNRRYILSAEERLSSESTARALTRGVERARKSRVGGEIDVDASAITCDTQFTGGAIRIGEREVEASERLERDLGVIFRPVEETMRDMAESLLDDM